MTTQDILNHFKESAPAVQARLGISRQVWYHWTKFGVPAKWQIKLHNMTMGGLPL